MMRAAGVDIGGTSAQAGLVDKSGALVRLASLPMPEGDDPEPLLAGLRDMLGPLLHGGKAEGAGVLVADFLKPASLFL